MLLTSGAILCRKVIKQAKQLVALGQNLRIPKAIPPSRGRPVEIAEDVRRAGMSADLRHRRESTLALFVVLRRIVLLIAPETALWRFKYQVDMLPSYGKYSKPWDI